MANVKADEAHEYIYPVPYWNATLSLIFRSEDKHRHWCTIENYVHGYREYNRAQIS